MGKTGEATSLWRPLLVLLSLSGWARGLTCHLAVVSCNFPFEHEGSLVDRCVQLPGKDDGFYRCRTNKDDDNPSYGVCDSGCLDADGTPKSGGEVMETLGPIFCKTRPSRCVFPFTDRATDVTHNECANTKDGEGFWCATAVDDDGYVVPGHWGSCDVSSCGEDDPWPLAAEAVFVGNVSGTISFEQADEESPLVIKGSLSGLTPGSEHGFHVHENAANSSSFCQEAGPHFNPFNTRHGSPHEPSPHAGDLGNIVADDDGVATVDLSVTHATLASTIGGTSLRDRGGILSRGLVVHGDEDDLGDGLTETSGLTGSSGSRLACANIEAKAGFAAEFELTLIVIAVLAFIALLLLLLVICLVCYCCCCRKRRNAKSKPPKDDPDLAYVNGVRKAPLYDELSIPFIDASPAPTPKTGRSTERLSFLNRSSSVGRSRGSLSIPPPYAPPSPPQSDSCTEITLKGSSKVKEKAPKSSV